MHSPVLTKDSGHDCVGVIGGSGFVGREVIRQLSAAGYRTVNIDRQAPADNGQVEWRQADLNNANQLEVALHGCTHLILLAAEWRDDVRPISRYYTVNVDGTANVIKAANAHNIKHCIFTSSVSIYGPTTFEVQEDHPPNPINDYGKSKLLAEQTLLAWAKTTSDLALTIVRPTVIFGPGNRGNVWNLLNQMSNGPFMMIGNGTNKKSIAYVQNVSAFLLHRLSAPTGVGIFNYSDKPDFSMNELVELVSERLGRKSERRLGPLPQAVAMPFAKLFDAASYVLQRPFGITSERVMKFCANTQYSAATARKTGFEPPVAVRDALARTIDAEFGSLKK
jgi:GlcNAc-P-P-Und epimerase